MRTYDGDRMRSGGACPPSGVRGARLIVGLALLSWAGLVSVAVAGVLMAQDLLHHL